MSFNEIISIVAILISPIIAVCIGQWFQNKSERRKDKIELFKILMRNRALSWSLESVNALNVIDIVFSNDKNVRAAWKELYSCLCITSLGEAEAKKIQIAKYRLLEEMANALNYSKKINWETIQNPYLPTGLEKQMLSNQDNQQLYSDTLKIMNSILKQNANSELDK